MGGAASVGGARRAQPPLGALHSGSLRRPPLLPAPTGAQGPQTPGFLRGRGRVQPLWDWSRSQAPTGAISLGESVPYSCTPDVLTEAGKGQVMGLRSLGGEMTEAGLARVWLALFCRQGGGPLRSGVRVRPGSPAPTGSTSIEHPGSVTHPPASLGPGQKSPGDLHV